MIRIGLIGILGGLSLFFKAESKKYPDGEYLAGAGIWSFIGGLIVTYVGIVALSFKIGGWRAKRTN